MNDRQEGFGRIITADGDVYIGNWVDNHSNGKGKYIQADGAYYDGDWEDDKH